MNNPHGDAEHWRKLRWCLVAVAAVVTITTFPLVFNLIWWWLDSQLGRSQIKAYEFSEALKEAFTARLTLSTTLFQTAVALVAATWALVLVKKDDSDVRLDRLQERALLILSTLCLIFSCMSHTMFVHDMSRHAVVSGPLKVLPDITHRLVAHGLISQCYGLVSGAAIAALAVVSSAWLRGR